MGTFIGTRPQSCRGTGNINAQPDDHIHIAWERRFLTGKFLSLCVPVPLLLAFPLAALAAETTNSAPGPGTSHSAEGTTNGLGTFQLKRGFRIELVVSEPMVSAPVAMAFDENGRLFVVEMRGRDTRGAGLGRVRMLENMNEDGVFQNSTIYADNLTWPSAVACYAGGIFVATTPNIVYLKDTKGDGVADARQVVMSGFGGTNTLDPDFLPNNFNWGPDNRIHASSGGIGGEISAQNASGPPVSINQSDFCFDPQTLEVFPQAGPSESGLSFDSQGRKFVSDFVRPLLVPMYDPRYTLRNPYYPKAQPLLIAADPRSPIYSFVARSVGSSGRQSTNSLTTSSLTAARGCVVYRGFAFPTNYFDSIFMADPEAHIVHRLVLQDNGLAVVAQRPSDEPNTEFLISRDPSFRPVQLINGPDGALYIADMRDGGDRGRIYRILPVRFKRSKLPQLGKVKTYDLVSTLAQGDGWHRDTAARLLYERKDPAAPALLRGTLSRSRLAQARVLALNALAGMSALTEDDLLRALRDSDEKVRRQAVLLSETQFKNGDASAALLAQLNASVSDGSAGVRYQLAFTLGGLQRPDRAGALARILTRDLYQPWTENAVLSSVANGAGNLFTIVANDAAFRADTVGFEFLRQLATMIGVSGHQDAVSQAASFIARASLRPAQAYELLYDLGDGLYRTRSSLSLVDTQGALQSFYSGALNLAADTTQPEAVRTAATRLLGVSTLSVGLVADWLLLVCSPPTGPALQSAAVETLSRYNDPQVVDGFLQIWPILSPIARSRAISSLLSREIHASRILDALQNRSLVPSDLTSAQRNFLRTHSVPEIRSRALQLLGPVPMSRPEVISRYRPVLNLPGSPDRGRQVFQQRCAECHAFTAATRAPTLGPDLVRARTYSKDRLLSRIVEPNLNVRPDYATQVVESKEGQNLVGIVTDESTASLTLKQIDGSALVWPQLNVRGVQPQPWSLMPEGLEVGLSVQDMADLMEYIAKGR